MSDIEKRQDIEVEYSHSLVDVGKSADILQSSFQHCSDVGLDHLRQSTNTSNILLLIAGAIVTLIGADLFLTGNAAFIGALTVAAIGLFGMIWSWKQQERYTYWMHVADEYQRQLVKLVPLLKTENDLRPEAERKTATVTMNRPLKWLTVSHLWVIFHFLIVLLGLGLALMLYNKIS